MPELFYSRLWRDAPAFADSRHPWANGEGTEPLKRLLLGYGNSLRGDDGAAWELLEQARDLAWEQQVVHQLTPELAETILDYEQVVFVDATRQPGPPLWRPLRVLGRSHWSAHVGDPEWLLGLCQFLYQRNPEGWLLTLPGVDFGFGLGLSPTGQSGVREALELLRLGPPRAQTPGSGDLGAGLCP